jgi:hypothetical protein
LIDFWCFNATFSNIPAISWRPVLVVEEAGENHRPWASKSSALFLAHLAKGQVSFCHHLASVICPSIRRKLSHFNLLLRNHWAICNQILVEWSLDGPLPKLCQVIPISNQDGSQAKNRKKGG